MYRGKQAGEAGWSVCEVGSRSLKVGTDSLLSLQNRDAIRLVARTYHTRPNHTIPTFLPPRLSYSRFAHLLVMSLVSVQMPTKVLSLSPRA